MKFQSLKSKVVRSDRLRAALPGDILIRSDGQRLICCPVCLNYSSIQQHLTGPDPAPTLSPSVICGHQNCKAHFFVQEGQIQPC